MGSQTQILAESKITIDSPIGLVMHLLYQHQDLHMVPLTYIKKKRVWRHLCNPCAGETQEREIKVGHCYSQRRNYLLFSRVQGIRTSQDMTCRNVIKRGQNRKLTDFLKLKIMYHKGEYSVSQLNNQNGRMLDDKGLTPKNSILR